MIVFDSTEASSNSRLTFDISKLGQPSSNLEKWTGSDFLISSLLMPVATEFLVRRHLDRGAVLIQRKSFNDLLSSISDNSINASLSRMIAAGAKYAWQRIIMSTGIYVPDLSTGSVLIGEPRLNSHQETYVFLRPSVASSPNYKALSAIRRRIAMRGGYYLPLVCDDEIPKELTAWERDLRELSPTKEIYPTSIKLYDPPAEDDPLQELIEVRDWRRILARFDKIGPVRATALRDTMLEHHTDDTLFQALCLASWSRRKYLPKVKHWGKGTIQNVRDTLGVPDGFDITLEVANDS